MISSTTTAVAPCRDEYSTAIAAASEKHQSATHVLRVPRISALFSDDGTNSRRLSTNYIDGLSSRTDNSLGFPYRWDSFVKTVFSVVDGACMTSQEMGSANLLERVYFAKKLEEEGNALAAIDIIYREIDGRLRNGKFLECDRALKVLRPKALSDHVIIGILSITLAASKRLKARPRFFLAARQEIQVRGMDPTSLIDGLRGWKAANEKGVLKRKAAN